MANGTPAITRWLANVCLKVWMGIFSKPACNFLTSIQLGVCFGVYKSLFLFLYFRRIAEIFRVMSCT
ncbi:MAG: hypothetical protein AAB157_02980, partial [Candidatus Omnitrophota bacterium]